MVDKKNIWPKKITVDKRIVKILSEQTYENFPNAIREIITNSYDADATNVEINLSLNKELLTIEDNGWGMDENEFTFYLRIAGRRRSKSSTTPSGRFIIGQFGVGFLSVFPFFKTFTIETKKKFSNEIVVATIPCYKYFSLDKIIDITDINIQGKIKYSNSKNEDSYTKIILSGFTQLCHTFFYPSHDLKSRKNSIHNYGSVAKLKWKLCEDLPLKYENAEFNDYSAPFSPNLPFSVKFNDKYLFRPIYGKELIDSSTETMSIGKVKFKFFIVTDRKSVSPNEARYLKLRNLNIGVGERTNFGLGTEVGGARSRLHWLTGEILIVEGLNEILTVSREGFNFNPDYEKLKEFFIKKLASLSNQLEKEAEIDDFIKQKNEQSKIKNLNFLNPKIVNQKIEKLKGSISDRSTLKKQEQTLKDFEKKIKVKNKTFKVVLDKWNYKNDLFPAIKIEKDKLIINNDYPLFKGRKFTDLFIKIHLLLLVHFEDRLINKNQYNDLVKDVLNYFGDY